MTSTKVACPTCKKEVIWADESKFRPFCSDRCRLIDLGEWADGGRSLPADADYDDVTASDLNRE